MKPKNLAAPYKVATSKTTITIAWSEPDGNGCPVIGFELYRDTGNSDAISVLVDPAFISMKPSLRVFTITNLAPIAASFRFKLRALNMAGYTDSKPLSVVLSSIPDTPLTGPVSDPT